MRFKTLKHKTLEDTFGCAIEVADEGDHMLSHWEIAHTSTPVLQPMSATMKMVYEYWTESSFISSENGRLIVEYLKDYEMVVVDVKLVFESESI